jgi:hypothetical protein
MKHTICHTEAFNHHRLQNITFFAWSTLTSQSISVAEHSATLEILRFAMFRLPQLGLTIRRPLVRLSMTNESSS